MLMGAPLISHLLYADDLLIFLNGNKSSVRRFMQISHTYEKWSVQLINKDKSALFLSKKINVTRQRELFRLTGYVRGSFSTIYLRVPLVSGQLNP